MATDYMSDADATAAQDAFTQSLQQKNWTSPESLQQLQQSNMVVPQAQQAALAAQGGRNASTAGLSTPYAALAQQFMNQYQTPDAVAAQQTQNPAPQYHGLLGALANLYKQ